MNFAVTLEKDEKGYYVASAPELPGCHSQGKTKAEVLTNIQEAIHGYIASRCKHGEKMLIAELDDREVAY